MRYNFRVTMNDYDHLKWFELYKAGLLELEHAAMYGRIGEARAEIAVRLEILNKYPGLHKAECEAIQDALSNLRALEREEARLAEQEKKRLLEQTVRKLSNVFPPKS
jgi:hypothetical protein